IFWGLEMIAMGTEELRHVETFSGLLNMMKGNPIYAIGLTAVFTAVVQSSAITIGFAMSLTAVGMLNLVDSVYWVLGANVGTTATALIASIGGNYVGRQVAWAHCIYKVSSMLLFIPFAEFFIAVVDSGSISRSIANLHTILNLAAALIYFPFVKKGAEMVQKLFPPSAAEREYSVKYIHKGDWESPSVVLAHAERELMRMADI